ncbi:Scm-like with four MBT domains protein 1, partial [Goodea atripinnis]
VFDRKYFLVTMDDLCGIEESEGAGRSFLGHRDSPGIFPAQAVRLAQPGRGTVNTAVRRSTSTIAASQGRTLTKVASQSCLSLSVLGTVSLFSKRYKGKSYRATVEIVRTADRVADFCRKTCIKLECCPNLFGPRMVLEHCSENCSVLTKTKYTYYCGKKKSKRVGRPPGGHTNLEGGVKRRGRRRKRRKQLFVHKKRRSSASVDNTPAGSPQGSGEEEDLDEDDSLSEDTGSEMQDDLQDDSEQSVGKSQPATPSPSPPLTPRPSRRRRKPRSPSFSDDENHPPSPKVEPPQKLCLDTSPLEWSVSDVVRFIRTTDCAPLARIFLDQEIDGQALLLLNLPTVQECMDLKLGPAIKLCHHIERVKLAFYQQFATLGLVALAAGPGGAALPAVSAANTTAASSSPAPGTDTRGCENGALMDSFGIFLQGLLAVMAFSTLMCEYDPKGCCVSDI